MWNNKKVVVSMTSYPKRIMNVGKCVFYLTQQTIKPDEIHLWLAKTEFERLEKSLPKDLQVLINAGAIIVHWLDENTYCFKRHEIFNLNKEQFYCFFIDDDVKYQNNLIESTLKLSDKVPNTIINYTNYGRIHYVGKHQCSSADTEKAFDIPTPNNRWCGQSMIPSWIYPMEFFEDKWVNLRKEICPVCDETWMTQFFIKDNIKVFNNNLPWGHELNPVNCNKIGIIQQVKQLDKDGLNFRDRCLIEIFKYFPENEKYYREHFNYQ